MTEWREVRLGDLLTVKHGYAFKGEYFAEEGDFVLLTPGNFRAAGGLKLDLSDVRYYDGPIPSDYVLAPGDLLVVMTDLKQDAPILGAPAFVPRGPDLLHNQRLGLVQWLTPAEIDARFVYYFMCSAPYRNAVRASATGSTVRHTAPDRIRAVELLLPGVATQRRIAHVLTTFDELIENNRRRIEILEETAQSLYREWFVRFRFPGHESAGMVDSPLGLIPDDWTVESFSALGEFLNGYAFKPIHWQEEGTPIIKIKELKHGVTPATPRYPGTDIPERYRVTANDLLFSWSGDLDAYLWAGPDGWLNQHLFRVNEIDGVPRSWLFLSLRDWMPEFRLRSQGTTMKHIQRSALNQVHTVRPSPNILSAFDDLADPVLRLIQRLRIQSATLAAARDLLLPRLVTGTIDVESLGVDDVFGWAAMASEPTPVPA